MLPTSLDLPVGPQAARIFFGYRAQALKDCPQDDEVERKRRRDQFLGDLGSTFMPGTPLMQAPLGLSAYVPAVIDPEHDAGLPDEVAIIVYSSLDVYNRFREISLSRRMYTKSHDAVFDMPNSIAQVPGPAANPASRQVGADTQQFLYLSDTPVDWQGGVTRVMLIVPDAPSTGFQDALRGRLEAARGKASELGVDQIMAGIAPGFAALWAHSAEPIEGLADALGLLPDSARLFRDLPATPSPVIGEREKGVKITGACAYTFRFSRFMEFFDDRTG
ncbi:MAG: hypothetical protein ABIW83_00300 [Allosphingosinicella sp.]